MDLFEKYRALNLDGSLIALAYAEMEQPYFCYPQNAKTIGFEGCILYCFLPEYPGMVFAANPASFADFMRLILACGSANPVEQIAWMDQAQFKQHLKREKEAQTLEQKALLSFLARALELTPMAHPFEYVKALQADFDGSKIQYRDAYYDVLGIPR